MKVFGLKNCDTCRKALKALRAAGHAPDVHDVREDGLSRADLDRWARAVGWETLLNTRSTTWRGLDAGEKADLDERKALALMAAHPALVKRPVIEADGVITVGWTKDGAAALGVPFA